MERIQSFILSIISEIASVSHETTDPAQMTADAVQTHADAGEIHLTSSNLETSEPSKVWREENCFYARTVPGKACYSVKEGESSAGTLPYEAVWGTREGNCQPVETKGDFQWILSIRMFLRPRTK